MKKIWDLYKKYREVIDYLFWGAVAFFLYMFIIWIFIDKLGWEEKFATLIDNFIVIVFAFFTNKFFVFRSKSKSVAAFLREFVEFFAARIFTLVLSEIMIWLGCDVLGFDKDSYHLRIVSDAMIVQLITQFVVIVANYVFSKLWIFKKEGKGSKKADQEA
ncbi:MAG: GtrA family protein [Lachnospiraceae bacterium]|nr:GtrA family protein [Lachnospiraceae bacterium]